MKGFEYSEKPGSVFERNPVKMDVATVFGGMYVMNGSNIVFNYGRSNNVPKNIHDI